MLTNRNQSLGKLLFDSSTRMVLALRLDFADVGFFSLITYIQ